MLQQELDFIEILLSFLFFLKFLSNVLKWKFSILLGCFCKVLVLSFPVLKNYIFKMTATKQNKHLAELEVVCFYHKFFLYFSYKEINI